MNKNPFETLVEVMRDQGKVHNPPPVTIGKVITVSPLTVQVNGIILDSDNLLIADYLKDTYARKIELTETGVGTTDAVTVGIYGTHSHTVNLSIDNKDLNFIDTLVVDDKLAILQSGEIFIIMCRAVSV